MDFHGILLDMEFKDPRFLYKFKILGKKKSERNPWTLYRVSVPAEDISRVIKEVQENLIDGPYYAHFYHENEVIVIFKKKIIRMTQDRTTWREAIEYGRSIGILDDQLTFFPCRFEDETY